MARDLAASIVKEFMRENFSQRASVNRVASEFLQEEAEKLKKKLEESEAKLQRYKEQNQAVSLEERQNIIVERLRELSTKVTSAKGERLRLESDIEQVRAAGPQNIDQLLRIASVSQIPQVAEHRGRLLDAETEFAAMQDRYGSLHPKYITASTRIDSLKQALHENVGKAGDILNGQYEAAVQTETKLSTALKEQETVALELNKIAIPFNVLQRDVESDSALYQSVIKRMKETTMTVAVEQTPYTLVEEAMVAYMERANKEDGCPWYAIARHMLGLYHGQRGGRLWRQVWSNHKLKPMPPREVMAIAREALAKGAEIPA
jgi:uncharacterized protein involved in exopolysaccharide biosynthesis